MKLRQRHEQTRAEPIEAVIDRVRPKLDGLINRFRIPPEDAQDILQQTFLVFLQKRQLIRDNEAWLVCVARRYCLRYLRSRRERFHESLDSSLHSLSTEPEQVRRSLLRDLSRAVSQIPERCRSVLQLRYGLGYRSEEVAEQTGYKTSSVRKVASRCVAALSRQLLVGRRG